MGDCRCKAASLPLRNRLREQDSKKQGLGLYSTHLSDDTGELSAGSARSTRVHWFIYKTLLFSTSYAGLLTISSLWESCRLLPVLLVINGHSKGFQVLRIDSAFALEGTADNGVWYSNMSLPDFWLTVTQTRSPPSHGLNLVTFTAELASPV